MQSVQTYSSHEISLAINLTFKLTVIVKVAILKQASAAQTKRLEFCFTYFRIAMMHIS